MREILLFIWEVLLLLCSALITAQHPGPDLDAPSPPRLSSWGNYSLRGAPTSRPLRGNTHTYSGGSHQNTYLCKRSCEQTGTYGGRSQAALAATVDWTCGEIFTEHAEPICDCYSVMGGSWLCVCAPYRGPMKHLREEEETCVRLGRRSTPE